MCDSGRSWFLENSGECKDLPFNMPDDLFQREGEEGLDIYHGGHIAFQEDNGVLDWSGRYGLFDRRR